MRLENNFKNFNFETMDYKGLIFSLIGVFTLVCAYYEYEWFMNNRKVRFLSKILGRRSRARVFYIGLGILMITLGILGTFKVINLD